MDSFQKCSSSGSGDPTDASSSNSGGAIYISGTKTARISIFKCDFSDCCTAKTQYGSGGSIYANNIYSVNINESTFSHCLSFGSGGAVFLSNIPETYFCESRFVSCEAAINGGGVCLWNIDSPQEEKGVVIYLCEFHSCKCSATHESNTINEKNLEENYQSEGGCIFQRNSEHIFSVSLEETLCYSGSAPSAGGVVWSCGILRRNEQVILLGCFFSNNTITDQEHQNAQSQAVEALFTNKYLSACDFILDDSMRNFDILTPSLMSFTTTQTGCALHRTGFFEGQQEFKDFWIKWGFVSRFVAPIPSNNHEELHKLHTATTSAFSALQSDSSAFFLSNPEICGAIPSQPCYSIRQTFLSPEGISIHSVVALSGTFDDETEGILVNASEIVFTSKTNDSTIDATAFVPSDNSAFISVIGNGNFRMENFILIFGPSKNNGNDFTLIRCDALNYFCIFSIQIISKYSSFSQNSINPSTSPLIECSSNELSLSLFVINKHYTISKPLILCSEKVTKFSISDSSFTNIHRLDGEGPCLLGSNELCRINIDTVRFLNCTSEDSLTGGVLMCNVLSSESLVLSSTDIEYCSASGCDVTENEHLQSELSRGGALFLYQRDDAIISPDFFKFESIKFSDNQAAIGRNVFIALYSFSSISTQMFNFLRSPSYYPDTEENAYCGSERVTYRENVDLLSYFSVKSDIIYISDEGSQWPFCGDLNDPCNSVECAIHNINKAENEDEPDLLNSLFVSSLFTIREPVCITNITLTGKFSILVKLVHNDIDPNKGVVMNAHSATVAKQNVILSREGINSPLFFSDGERLSLRQSSFAYQLEDQNAQHFLNSEENLDNFQRNARFNEKLDLKIFSFVKIINGGLLIDDIQIFPIYFEKSVMETFYSFEKRIRVSPGYKSNSRHMFIFCRNFSIEGNLIEKGSIFNLQSESPQGISDSLSEHVDLRVIECRFVSSNTSSSNACIMHFGDVSSNSSQISLPSRFFSISFENTSFRGCISEKSQKGDNFFCKFSSLQSLDIVNSFVDVVADPSKCGGFAYLLCEDLSSAFLFNRLNFFTDTNYPKGLVFIHSPFLDSVFHPGKVKFLLQTTDTDFYSIICGSCLDDDSDIVNLLQPFLPLRFFQTVYVSSVEGADISVCGEANKPCKKLMDGISHLDPSCNSCCLVVEQTIDVPCLTRLSSLKIRSLNNESEAYFIILLNESMNIEQKYAVELCQEINFQKCHVKWSEYEKMDISMEEIFLVRGGCFSMVNCFVSPSQDVGRDEWSYMNHQYTSISCVVFYLVNSQIIIDNCIFANIRKVGIGPSIIDALTLSSFEHTQTNCTIIRSQFIQCTSSDHSCTVMRFVTCPSFTMKDSNLTGIPTVEPLKRESDPQCNWETGMLLLESCRSMITMCNFKYSEYGAINLIGGEIALCDCGFISNGIKYKDFPSFQQNIACSKNGNVILQSMSSSTQPPFSFANSFSSKSPLSISLINQTPPTSALQWISSADCTIYREPKATLPSLFSPSVLGASGVNANGSITLSVVGNVLIPCSLILEIGYYSEKDGEFSWMNIPSKVENETHIYATLSSVDTPLSVANNLQFMANFLFFKNIECCMKHLKMLFVPNSSQSNQFPQKILKISSDYNNSFVRVSTETKNGRYHSSEVPLHITKLPSKNRTRKNNLVIILSVTIPFNVFIICVSISLICIRKQVKKKHMQQFQSFEQKLNINSDILEERGFLAENDITQYSFDEIPPFMED